ncbi:MAG: hypothetical protein ACOCWV_05665 [Planctomycetota bacterium]
MRSHLAFGLLAAVATIGAVGGCASIDEPRVVAPRVFEGRDLAVAVAPYADRPESHPDIREVRIEVDPGLFGSADTVTRFRVEQSRGKLGPTQTVHFTAPRGASAIDVHLTVDHGRNTFRVTVPFRHIRTPDAHNKRWIRMDERLDKTISH